MQGGKPPSVKPVSLENEGETLALGAALARMLEPGDVVALSGELGAGKTTLARGLIQSRLGEIEVPSPTYTLVQTYEWGEAELWHCDLYRLERPDDVFELGLIDAMEDAVVLIEWADRMGAHLPDDAKRVHIRFDADARVAELDGFDD